MIYPFFRSLLFRLDTEQAHGLTLGLLRLAGALPPLRVVLRSVFAAPRAPVQAFGLTFNNPVGLAAGYDKDGLGWRGLAALGFGHIEIGTVTLHPQPGNPRPRVFRLVEDQAVINRMGFPGQGAQVVAARLRKRAARLYQRDGHSQARAIRRTGEVVLGVNLGKNKDTPLDLAVQDYLHLMDIFAPLADYLAINVSSPNTVGLRQLQAHQALEGLLIPLAERQRQQALELGRRVPLLVKLAPDLSEAELDGALVALLGAGVDGVIATNTTLSRHGLVSPRAVETGGLSGSPLRVRSLAMLRQIQDRAQGRLPVVSAGGIMNARDVRERLEAGAVLVQVYTGLVYAGPGLVKQIMSNLPRQ